LDHNSFRNLISGADKGFGKTLLRLLLRIISVGYTIAILVRNYAYDKGIAKISKVDVPVISIGNITTGGTGKTPLVIWICKKLSEKSIPYAVLTRGYKAQDAEITDEPAILARSCPDTRVIVNADRVAAANKAVTEYGVKTLVMDDGFQHRRLHRDLDIIAIDATCPFGFERMLPAGLLRESKNAIKRAQAVVITRYDQSTPENTEYIVNEIKKIAPDITIAKATHKHTCAKMMKGKQISLDELKELEIFAFCGVGNPDAFLGNLKSSGFNLKGSKIFNDHHDFSEEDMVAIYDEAKKLEVGIILSTEKDWVKTALLVKDRFDIDFAFLTLELDFIEGADKIEALINDLVEKP
jgi:tetraacyldisaccharide 4'-kinase